jgi:hypothetical protein
MIERADHDLSCKKNYSLLALGLKCEYDLDTVNETNEEMKDFNS